MTMPTGSLEEQLRPQLLSGLAFERLLEEIVSGRLPPGQRLRLDLLAHAWSVSRTPVREALQRLVDMRFVEVSPNAGTRVAEWSTVDMIERAHVIGRLIVEKTCSGPSPRAHLQDPLVAEDACELLSYLELSEQLISRELGRLGTRIVHDHIDPLRLFVDPQTAIRHGVDFAADRASRRNLLSAAFDAIERQDPLAAREALDAFSASFIDALGSGTAQAVA
ncbi:GntR family transcriptional regulator [Microbacterium sp. APC 3901]|uniref:GntR family transcriptional regulator n=1 Tax=Microbacterium sp. APC 3901 TaxID=3035192 RepID=UPI0025B41930|nr:GntR family transcriptional regulator [Microbacterium sp. APC 3901]MDN3444213.1 GntR family transcriptional regulator [Microbacterium sp. APC 3901]